MTPTEFCDKYGACSSGRNYALTFETMAQVWDACERPDWLFWILEKHAPLEKEQSVRLAVAFAETVIHLVAEGENRPGAAIEAAKAWLANPTEENRAAARAAADAARAAASQADYAAAHVAYAAAVYTAYNDAHAAHAARAAHAAYAGRGNFVITVADICNIIRGAIKNPFIDQP